MKTDKIFQPFHNIVVVVAPGVECEAALGLARALGGRMELFGLVPVSASESLSAAARTTRALRKSLHALCARQPDCGLARVIASQSPWQDLLAAQVSNPPDLLVVEWPLHFEQMGAPPPGIFDHPPCDLAIVRGPWPEQTCRMLVPMRGGPYAELALRLGLALPHEEVEALNIVAPGAAEAVEAPFRGLARVLPSLSGVNFQREVSAKPVSAILERAEGADVIVMGSSARTGESISAVTREMFARAPGAMVVVKTRGTAPEQWSGPEGERAGGQAISLLVDRWFAENTYHADEFDDLERMVRLKQEQGLTISLALPALNEEGTVGTVIRTVKEALQERHALLDEIVLIDSNSSDRTREIAAEMGVPVHIHQQLLAKYGARRGKGEALWKSLLVTRGDIVVWIDTDIVNIDPRFVYGVIGPLLVDPRVQFVKGFYQRPLRDGAQLQAGGGGRVTELTARPLLNLFYPELSGVIQPLSGEYGGRRKALEQMAFFSGYGVEIGLLIDVLEKYGLASIAQVDLLERVHHNQTLEALSKMSFTIIQAVLRKLERRYGGSILEEINKSMKLIRHQDGGYYLDVEEVVERERPPMVEVEEYRQAFNPGV